MPLRGGARLMFSDLSGSVYIVKRGRAYPDGRILSSDKVDVTADFEQIVLMREAWKERSKERAKLDAFTASRGGLDGRTDGCDPDLCVHDQRSFVRRLARGAKVKA